MNGIKPPYRIPSMKEIEQIPWNGYTVVSTFSGGGGSCLGYRMAGYKVLWANEFVEEAQKTYRANHPGTILNTQDIRTVTAEDILRETGLSVGELDIFDGSPPCCAFSTCGRREAVWNKVREYSDGKKQQIENLFFEYIRILNGLQPKVFIAENVSGLVKGAALGYFKEFIREMKKCGYQVSAKLLNAAYLGVPTSRERIIFIGVRNDLNLKPVHPDPLPYCYTFGDAVKDVKNDPEEEKMRLEVIKGTKMYSIIQMMPKNSKKVMKGSKLMNGSWFNLSRESMYRPCSTLTTTSLGVRCSGTIHPLYDRKITIAEGKRITSLPDDFILTGTLDQQGERIARMVPPVMMMHIAETIQKEVLDKCRTM